MLAAEEEGNENICVALLGKQGAVYGPKLTDNLADIIEWDNNRSRSVSRATSRAIQVFLNTQRAGGLTRHSLRFMHGRGSEHRGTRGRRKREASQF